MPQPGPGAVGNADQISEVAVADVHPHWDIEDPLMQQLRYLDKLVDELAKGRPMEKVLRG